MLLLIILYLIVCFNEVHSGNFYVVSGVSTNFNIYCSIHEDIATFWMINGSLYGLLHAPNEFEVCGESRYRENNYYYCNRHSLRIPVVQSKMDGYTFQCVGIDYNTNTHHLGRQTELSVLTLNSSLVESLNSKLTTSCH